MNIIDEKFLEDCFDGSMKKELLLDEAIARPFIHYLGELGTMRFFPHFPRPFFQIDAGGLVIKGIENNSTLNLMIFDQTKLAVLKTHIESYEPE